MESIHFQRLVLLSLGMILYFGQGVLAQTERQTCETVSNIFKSYQFSPDIDTPENPISGAGLKVCQRDTTCCTRRMEENLQTKSSNDFRKAIQTNLDYLEFLLSSSANDFKVEYEELLTYGEARVQESFRILYISFALDLDNDIRDLFADLKTHLNGGQVKIQRSVRNFFDELFPLLYSEFITRVGRLDALFANCLSAKRAIIQPFGDIPRQVSTLLYNSVETSRILLKAVQEGSHVLNATFSMALSKKCSRSLLEMNYCRVCDGQTGVQPCHSYCLNVVKGCLANFMDLDAPWNDYVTSVIDLIRHSMRKDNDLQQAMSSLEYLFNDAINYAMENSGDITYEVHRLCGYASKGRPSPFNDFAAANPPSIDFPMVPNPRVPLDERLLDFVESLDKSRGVYQNLPMMMCMDGELGSTGDQACWTGQTVGEYTYDPIGNGLRAQVNNPEVSWTGREFELLQAFGLMDNLEEIIHLIRLKLRGKKRRVPAEPEFSGSGSGSGCSDDDEDCFSGSGSTSTVETETNTTDMVYTPTTKITQKVTTEETDFVFDVTTPRPSSSRTDEHHPTIKPSIKPTPSLLPFVPTKGRVSTKKPTARPTTVSVVDEVPKRTTPSTDGGGEGQKGKPGNGVTTPRISVLVVFLCFLVSWLSNRH
ncbi:glypican-5-like [Asterias amurensis]|uniref:glypican-5-like n=1 Tax=Asterias amurensis TaxID=7602 RepID=UPI003AB4AE57